MVTSRKSSGPTQPRRPPATTPEGVEDQMIALAVGLAKRQLEDGSASSQVVTHYLKLATVRERLEEEKLIRENELLRARSEAMQSAKRVEELYEDAITAMRRYSGQDVGDYES